MSDIKMSDVFPQAFEVDHNKSFEVQNCHWVTFGDGFHSNVEQDDAIACAVLNHDRLVEENAQLKADNFDLLKEQKRLQSMLYDALSCTGYFDAVKKGVYQIQPVRIYPQETKGN